MRQEGERPRRPAIWVVGSTMVDMITYADRLPERGETLVGRSFSLGFGGKGANQAVMARRLGADVAMVNCVGGDVFGEMTLENLRREGIDIGHVGRVDDAVSGVAPIWVEPTGANRILVVPGANERMRPEDAARAIGRAPAVDVVVGQLEIRQDVTAAAFAAAKARGATTILNPAPAAPLEEDLVRHTDWVIPNELELASLVGAGDPAAACDPAVLRNLGKRYGVRLVVTLGKRGAALVADDGRRIVVPASRVAVVDTTGAGDAFVGAFAYALATGRGAEAAARLGCLCATASVQRSGTQSSFPTSEEAAALLALESAAG